jgi:AcrR family transcriptional regulator
MTDQKRTYTKKRRAELEDETRLRITKSAMELHGTLGPSRTSISAVADRAGVRRSTVYRHFPDEEALFTACSTHWAQLNPPPDMGAWAAIEDPGKRLRAALGELYAYYERTEQMMDNLIRDEDLVPSVKRMFGGYRSYLEAAREVLMGGRRGRKRAAAIGHSLAFPTWRSLVREQGLTTAEAAVVMCRLIGSQA